MPREQLEALWKTTSRIPEQSTLRGVGFGEATNRRLRYPKSWNG